MSSNLDWENYKKSVINCFENAFNDKSYNDVTLVSDDFENFSAHRVILASCSPTFQKILQLGPHTHPMIYLRGFSSSQISYLLKFIYKGQVQVPTEDIQNFIIKAQELELLGNFEKEGKKSEENAVNDNDGCNKTSNNYSEKEMVSIDVEEKMLISSEGEYYNEHEEAMMATAAFQMKHLENVIENSDESEDPKDNDVESKAEIQKLLTGQKDLLAGVSKAVINETKKIDKALEIKSFPVDIKGDLKMIDTLMEEVYSNNGVHHCPQCEYKTNRKELLRTHLSSTHGGPKFVCTYVTCAREYSSKANVRSHMKSFHNCDKCDEKYEDNKDLKKHKKKEHPHPFLRL